MITKNTLKAYVSPAVAVTFAVVSVTGILMILDLGDIEDLHKWMGLAFVIAGAIHVAINWRVLIAYFRGRRIVVWGAAMLLVCALLLFAVGDRDVDDGLEGEAAEYVRELVDD